MKFKITIRLNNVILNSTSTIRHQKWRIVILCINTNCQYDDEGNLSKIVKLIEGKLNNQSEV